MQAETLRNGGAGGSLVWLVGLGFGVGFWSDVSGGEVGRVLQVVFIELLGLVSRDEDQVGDGCFSIVRGVYEWSEVNKRYFLGLHSLV